MCREIKCRCLKHATQKCCSHIATLSCPANILTTSDATAQQCSKSQTPTTVHDMMHLKGAMHFTQRRYVHMCDCVQVTGLKLLDLSGNAMQGTLPTAFASALPSLNVLLLGSNSLTGTLPAAWSSLTSLTVADLGDNHLKGSLPASWSAWSNLRGLRLTSNSLTGSLPAAYGSWAGIQELELGQRPYCLCCSVRLS